MHSLNTREPLAWALAQVRGKIKELDPGDEVTDQYAAWVLLKALRGSDLTAKGLRVRYDRVVKIPATTWHLYRKPQALLEDIGKDLIDPHAAVADGEDTDCYLAPSVACAELRDWLARTDGNGNGIEPPETPEPSNRNPGGRPPLAYWEEVWFRSFHDLYERGDLPKTIADLVRRIQEVCRRHNIAEPQEETLRPKARRWLQIMREDG
jgi:hypothetical protein